MSDPFPNMFPAHKHYTLPHTGNKPGGGYMCFGVKEHSPTHFHLALPAGGCLHLAQDREGCPGL
jgi:hypothetical protein